MDPRHAKRIKIIQNLFASTYPVKNRTLPYPDEKTTHEVLKNLDKIDKMIRVNAPKYPTDKIAKTDLSILRLSIYELLFEKQLPQKVVIDEAIELAKELSSDKSYAFVNAVLGKVVNSI